MTNVWSSLSESSKRDQTKIKSKSNAGDNSNDVSGPGQTCSTEGADFLALGLLPAPQPASGSFGQQAKAQILASRQPAQNLVTVGVVDFFPEQGRLRNSAGAKFQPEVSDVLVGVDVPAQVELVTISVGNNKTKRWDIGSPKTGHTE